MSQTINRLNTVRQRRGIAAATLAQLVGVSRQTIYAIESGSYVPNATVALKLARILETSVEELFALANEEPPAKLRTEVAELLKGSEAPLPGQPMQLCRVDERLIANSPSPVPWFLPAADAVASGKRSRGRVSVDVLDPAERFGNRLLVAGCDPGISVLSRHMLAAGVEVVAVHRNSSQSLELLRTKSIHIAGTHLQDGRPINRTFSRNSATVISFSTWEQGIVTAAGNPKSIRGVEDFVRKDFRIVNRESGSGARGLLDARLRKAGIAAKAVSGYTREAAGHLPAAWLVRSGEADACISTRAAARLFGLDFIPLVSERYDLVMHRQHMALPAVQVLLDTLNRAKFRREMESLGGYDTSSAGERRI